MRGLLAASAILLASAWLTGEANAQGYGCRSSGVSCEDLQYYCGLGDETPYSVRRFCNRRWGGPSYAPPSDRYPVQSYRQDDGESYPDIEPDDEEEQAYIPPSRSSYRELRYLCSLGQQTPHSVRRSCVRFGFW